MIKQRRMKIALTEAILLLLLGLAGCGEKVETAGVSEEKSHTLTDAMLPSAESDNAASTQKIVTDTEETLELRTQIAEAAALADLPAVSLPAVTGYQPEYVNLLSDEAGENYILEVSYSSTTGSQEKFYTRVAAGKADITGIADVAYIQDSINGSMLQTGEKAGKLVALWTDDSYTYAAIGTGMEQTRFRSLVGSFFTLQMK